MVYSEKYLIFAPDFLRKTTILTYWKVGRVIDRAGLEIRYTPFGYRGFESLTFRKTETTCLSSNTLVRLFFVPLSMKSIRHCIGSVYLSDINQFVNRIDGVSINGFSSEINVYPL